MKRPAKFVPAALGILLLAGSGWADVPTTSAVVPATEPSLPHLNFRLRPIALMAGIPGAEIQFGLLRFLSMSTGLQYFSSDISNTRFHVWELSVAFEFFLGGERFRTGWFLEPKGGYLPLSLDTVTANSWTFSLLVGRYWELPLGINASVGAGVAFFSSSASLTVAPGTGLLEIADSGSRANVEPALEFTVGWAF